MSAAANLRANPYRCKPIACGRGGEKDREEERHGARVRGGKGGRERECENRVKHVLLTNRLLFIGSECFNQILWAHITE